MPHTRSTHEPTRIAPPSTDDPVRPFRRIGIFYPEIKIGGGIALVIVLLAGELAKRGYRVWLFTRSRSRSGEFPLPEGVERVELPDGDEESLAAMEKWLSGHAIELCLFQDHWTEQSFRFMDLAVRLERRTVATVHSNFFFPFYGARLELLARRLEVFRRLSAVTCLSEHDLHWWRATGITHSACIPNPSPYDPAATRKASWGSREILFIGRLERHKGLWYLPRIFRRIADRIPDARFTILGDFARRRDSKPFHQELRSLDVQDQVHIQGLVRNVGEYLEKSAVLIMPSSFEGQPMTRMEAAAHGLPVVSFDMPYLALRDTDSGCVMVGKEDVEGMAEATARLVTDRDHWRALSDNALHSLEPYAVEKIADRWETLFRSILRGSVEADCAPRGEDGEILAVTMNELHAGAKAYAGYVEEELRCYTYLKPLHKAISRFFPAGSARRDALASLASRFRKKRG